MRIFLIALLAAISYAQTVNRGTVNEGAVNPETGNEWVFANPDTYEIPCVAGKDEPAGCARRIKPCSDFSASELEGVHVIEEDRDYECSAMRPKIRDTLFTPPSNNRYFVKFTGIFDECWGIIMQAGECWGDQPDTGANYDCQGRCGPGCRANNFVISNWARDCLKHDVCSWFFGAKGGGSSVTCGDEYDQAFNDWFSVLPACVSTGDSCGDAGKWMEIHKKSVCFADRCKGTRWNPIPRRQKWVRLRRASEKGCCAWGRGPCDWCAPPYPGESHVIHMVESESEVSNMVESGESEVSNMVESGKWTVISEHLACEWNDEGITRTFGEYGFNFETCKARCLETEGCKAIDYYKGTGWCNLFDIACSTPSSSHDGASSWMLDVPCGDNICDEGEFMTCPDDCKQEIKDAVCECAIANELCGETCPAVMTLTGQCSSYGVSGICGGIIDSNAVYRDICDGCPPEVQCGDNICDEGEFMTCPDDCKEEIKDAVCECAIANELCGETCPAVMALNGECSTYGVSGICGGIIDSNAVYRDICDGCPPEEHAVAFDGLELANERLRKANKILRQTLEEMEAN